MKLNDVSGSVQDKKLKIVVDKSPVELTEQVPVNSLAVSDGVIFAGLADGQVNQWIVRKSSLLHINEFREDLI